MTDSLLVWIVAAVLLGLDLLAGAVKASLSYARLPYLMSLREGREAKVDRTIAVIEKPRLRSSLRLAMAFFHFLLAGLLPMILQVYSVALDIWLVLFYLVLEMVLVNILEFLIEGMILKDTEENAIRLSGLGGLINSIFSPLAGLLMGFLGDNANKVTLASMTEEDLKNWVEVGQPEGSLEKGEREMIYSIFQFGDTLAKDIMVPRIDVMALDIKTTLGEARSLFVHAGHSRVPVYEDTVDNVVGLLYAKDLLSVRDDDALIANHRDLLRLAYFVPEAKKVDELLAEMQSRSMHMAVVVDEYGGVAGLVTLEDIVEEIVGEIRDEYDESEEMPFEQINADEYVFQGKIDLDIFNEIMGTEIATDNADTIGGYIYGQIGDVPTGGESLKADGVKLIVDEVVGRRINKVRAIKMAEHPVEKDKNHADK
ncbi:MAG: HlyC/CorC family transporter [Anaerolineaceae bacterium]|nr:HlyC/CorC family transporter [Anaerolineaceae bacterium]